MTMDASVLSRNIFYECRGPLHRLFGAQVHGLDLRTADFDDPLLVKQIKSDLRRHRLLLFRDHNPAAIPGARQVEFSSKLGRVESTFYRHPRSPHPDVFRVSNDEAEGCTGVGRSGWHVDGTFLRTPFAYQTMHFPSASEGGDTLFVPLRELYERQGEETKKRWDSYWMITSGRRGDAPVHPLVYRHPYRGDVTLCFHCGEPFVSGWLVDDGTGGTVCGEGGSRNDLLGDREVLPARSVQDEIAAAVESASDDLVLRLKWREGDFAINDNLGLAHLACLETQRPRREVGLRILHRTTVLVDEEDTVPTKEDGRRTFVL